MSASSKRAMTSSQSLEPRHLSGASANDTRHSQARMTVRAGVGRAPPPEGARSPECALVARAGQRYREPLG